MSKYLVISDLHITDKSKYLTYQEYKSNVLATASFLHDLIDHCKISTVLVCGDIFHKVNPGQLAIINFYDFFNELTKDNSVITYMIDGNHTTDSKSDSSSTPSLLKALCDNYKELRLKYLDDELITLPDGHTLYALGYRPKLSLENKPNADIFIGHAYLNGANECNGMLISSNNIIPKNKYRMSFVGDIHQPQRLNDNIVIPGATIQLRISDPAEPSVIVYDPADNSAEFVKIISTCSKVYYKSNESKIEHKSDNDKVIDDTNKINFKVKKDLSSIKSSLNYSLDEALNELLGCYKYKNEIIADAKSGNTSEGISGLNCNFRINHVRIVNFKSINDLYLDFNNLNKLIFVKGKIGSGKSSIIQAIKFALDGKSLYKDSKASIKIGRHEMSVELSLTYNDHEYVIKRSVPRVGSMRLEFYEDKSQITAFSTKDCDAKILNTLPFINDLDLLIQDQSRANVFGQYSASKRLALISKTAKLDQIISLRSNLETKVRSLGNDLDKSNKEVISLESSITTLRNSLKQLDSIEAPKRSEAEVQNDIDEVNKQLVEINSYAIKHSAWLKSFNDTTSLIESFKSKRDSLKSSLNSSICPTCGQKLVNDECKANLLNEIDKLNRDIASKNDELDSLMLAKPIKPESQDVSELNNKLYKLNQESKEIYNYTKIGELIVKQSDELSEKENKLSATTDYVRILSEKVDEYYGAFKTVFSESGSLVAYFLNKFSVVLNDMLEPDGAKVELYRMQKNGNCVPDFQIMMKVDKEWIPYDQLSGGQTLKMDLLVLKCLLEFNPTVGIMTLDELLKYFDKDNVDTSLEILRSYNASNIIIVAHNLPDDFSDTPDSSTIELILEENSTSYKIL